jgi:hypothetical protein
MSNAVLSPFQRLWNRLDGWLNNTPERSLDQAYDAVLNIQALENTHNQGRAIDLFQGDRTETLLYCRAEVKRYLQKADVRLKEFKASRYVVDSTNTVKSDLNLRPRAKLYDAQKESVILEKLRFIDSVLGRYRPQRRSALAVVALDAPMTLVPEETPPPPQLINRGYEITRGYESLSDRAYSSPVATSTSMTQSGPQNNGYPANPGAMDKPGALPRSISGALNRIRQELDPNAEVEMVKSFRKTRNRTLISIRFLLLLVILPLLAQQLSKALVVGPLVDQFRLDNQSDIFINPELRQEGLRELKFFEDQLRFETLLKPAPALKDSEIQDKLKDKAEEIALDFSRRSANAVKNVFADLAAMLTFGIVLLTNRESMIVLKDFVDETIYGLSDSAKAFILILLTDVFVGFHSPHGWEVLLDGFAKHIGIVMNPAFSGLFIATFPVILDTIFKYWIFRYLNRISPSAVATYKNMNE